MSSSSNTGILKWNGTTFEKVYTTSYSWQYWFESSTGDIFVSSAITGTGILKWNGTAFTKEYAIGYMYEAIYEIGTTVRFVSTASIGYAQVTYRTDQQPNWTAETIKGGLPLGLWQSTSRFVTFHSFYTLTTGASGLLGSYTTASVNNGAMAYMLDATNKKILLTVQTT